MRNTDFLTASKSERWAVTLSLRNPASCATAGQTLTREERRGEEGGEENGGEKNVCMERYD